MEVRPPPGYRSRVKICGYWAKNIEISNGIISNGIISFDIDAEAEALEKKRNEEDYREFKRKYPQFGSNKRKSRE